MSHGQLLSAVAVKDFSLKDGFFELNCCIYPGQQSSSFSHFLVTFASFRWRAPSLIKQSIIASAGSQDRKGKYHLEAGDESEEDTNYNTWMDHGTHTETRIQEMSASVTAHTKAHHHVI